jgi:hypothetical protein
VAVSKYATTLQLNRPAPAHVTDPEDLERIRAYGTYEDIWNNVPEAFAALLREDDPLARRYVPVVREIIEATNRYLAVNMETVWTPLPGVTIPDDAMAEWMGRLDAFWAREEVDIKSLSVKRFTLVKGDGLLHVTADPTKAEGMRIRLTEIEAEQYFPIYDPADGERVIGCYLVSIVQDDEDEDVVQRIEYRKIRNEEESAEFATPVGSIFYRVGYFEMDGWDDRQPDADEPSPVDAPSWAAAPEGSTVDPLAGFPLDARITTIPVYHFRNRRRGGKVGRFGTSEIQGLETVFAGIIQNTTDEDLTVAMQGLGVYWTDSGKAKNSDGSDADWVIGPASVLELEKDGKVGRVDGVSSVQPFQDHIKFMMETVRGASAVPEIASGRTQSSAEISGVALRIQFMPTLSANAEREADIASVWTHLLYDLLNMWFPVYEGWNPLQLQPSVAFGDPLPPDRAAVIAEVTSLLTPVRIVSLEWAAKYLSEKLGYDFPADMLAKAAAEQQALLDAEAAQIATNAGQVPSGDPEA